MADSRHITTLRSGAMTRRALFAGAAATISSVALGAAIAPSVMADEVCSAALDPLARFEAAKAEFKAASLGLYPDIDHWREVKTDAGVIMIGMRPLQPETVDFTGYGVYEISKGKTTPIVALARSESGQGYYWQLAWRHADERQRWRFQGKVKFVKNDEFTIKRKIAALA